MKNPFSFSEWIGFLGAFVAAVIVALFTFMNFAYSTFQTQRESQQIDKRLDRIEVKLDSLLEVSHR